MNKRNIVVLFALSALLTSCSSNIREELLDFLDPMTIDRAILNTNKAYMEYRFVSKDNTTNEVTNYSISYYYFDKTSEDNYYVHRANFYKGSYMNPETRIIQEVVTFNHLSDDKYEKVTTSLTLDGDVTHNNEETNKDATYDFIEDFFFTTVQNDVHSGGYYYAEDIGVIISYQDFMTISEDKKFLTVNFEDFVLEGVTNSLTYTINTLGMLVDYSMHSYDESQTLDGTITIKYNNEANDFDLDNMEDK